MAGHNYAINTMHRAKCQRKGPRLVRHWFNQAARKLRRRQNRSAKAAACFPCPTQKLLPVVNAPTLKYAGYERLGRGFSVAEVKAAKMTVGTARQHGIKVDLRRNSKRDSNVERINEYMSKLVILTKPEEIKAAEQITGTIMPYVRSAPVITTDDVSKYATEQHIIRNRQQIRKDFKAATAAKKEKKEARAKK